MESIKDLLKQAGDYTQGLQQRKKYISQEFQDFGYRMAVKLEDEKRVSLYMRLAKQKPRVLLEKALSFTVDYPNARNKGRIFMWKLKELEAELNGGKQVPEDSSKKTTSKNKKPTSRKKNVKKT